MREGQSGSSGASVLLLNAVVNQIAECGIEALVGCTGDATLRSALLDPRRLVLNIAENAVGWERKKRVE